MTRKIILDSNILNEEEEKYEQFHIHSVNTIKKTFEKKFNYFNNEFVIVERNCYVLVFEFEDYDIVGVLDWRNDEDVNFYLELHNEIQLIDETNKLYFEIK